MIKTLPNSYMMVVHKLYCFTSINANNLYVLLDWLPAKSMRICDLIGCFSLMIVLSIGTL